MLGPGSAHAAGTVSASARRRVTHETSASFPFVDVVLEPRRDVHSRHVAATWVYPVGPAGARVSVRRSGLLQHAPGGLVPADL